MKRENRRLPQNSMDEDEGQEKEGQGFKDGNGERRVRMKEAE